MIEVDKSVSWPELLPKLVACHDVAGLLQQDDEDVDRPATYLERPPLLPQLARAGIQLVYAEAIHEVGRF